uniref:BZIP domain-containing protein n=1 Tax=Rhizochromulina marina TaxID=1034831 RepID=A0A7S2REX0_9STRA|mmetsp:Transcript_14746/g.43704  ORF Transcript_14746/g.43704 Transcript_14746/m.43704 type:complete len:463 (+) Transcript_14746:138-1526(+)
MALSQGPSAAPHGCQPEAPRAHQGLLSAGSSMPYLLAPSSGLSPSCVGEGGGAGGLQPAPGKAAPPPPQQFHVPRVYQPSLVSPPRPSGSSAFDPSVITGMLASSPCMSPPGSTLAPSFSKVLHMAGASTSTTLTTPTPAAAAVVAAAAAAVAATATSAPNAMVTSGALLHSQTQVPRVLTGGDSKKRRRLSSEERLQRSRERNRMHAKKTRQRKKMQIEALQARIDELKTEFLGLRQIVDERYTAYILLVMSGAAENGSGASFLSSSAEGPSTLGSKFTSASLAQIIGRDPDAEDDKEEAPQKRTRRRGKYTPAEREHIRRERNRMHAKRTRDRKKLFLEESERKIAVMEEENAKLRDFLTRHGMLDSKNAVPKPAPRDTSLDRDVEDFDAEDLEEDDLEEEEDLEEDEEIEDCPEGTKILATLGREARDDESDSGATSGDGLSSSDFSKPPSDDGVSVAF